MVLRLCFAEQRLLHRCGAVGRAEGDTNVLIVLQKPSQAEQVLRWLIKICKIEGTIGRYSLPYLSSTLRRAKMVTMSVAAQQAMTIQKKPT